MYTRALTATVCAYSVLHHLGLLPAGPELGVALTRWSDWFDLALPWLIMAPAAAALTAARPPRRVWVLFGAGAIAYASGHGIHLAANSVGNVSPGPTAHLWDGVVGHYIWFAGVALILAALAATMTSRPRPPLWGYALGIAAGLTWATNAIGGGTALFSLLVALVAVGYGWRHRRDLAAVLLVGFVPSCLLLAGYLLLGLAGVVTKQDPLRRAAPRRHTHDQAGPVRRGPPAW